MKADEIDIPMDYDSVAKAGSMLGSGGMVVMDEDTCMVDMARRIMPFLRARILRVVHSVPRRHDVAAQDARTVSCGTRPARKISTWSAISRKICSAARSAARRCRALPTISIVGKWRDEFVDHLNGRCCL